jgi:hypothetical protein
MQHYSSLKMREAYSFVQVFVPIALSSVTRKRYHIRALPILVCSSRLRVRGNQGISGVRAREDLDLTPFKA